MATRYQTILKTIEAALAKFNDKVPPAQREMYQDLLLEVGKLDLNGDTIKATVANLQLISRIKAKINKLLVTEKYKKSVKEFAKAFNEITVLQHEYWRGIEKDFKPRPLLREIRKAAISDTVKALGEAGIGASIGEQITEILRTNITSGGSYRVLTQQLRQALTDTKTPGLLTKYSKQITTDAINQYNAQYTQTVSSDLGFEWFAYQGSDIKTTRPFCDAMTDLRYFHVTEIPRLLKADNLYYTKKGKKTKVPIYDKTGLPHGLIEGTNPENFFIRRGGYNCGHQIRPVSEKLVPAETKQRVVNTTAYKNFKRG